MDESEGSCYSNDEEYFLDLCRAGELEELQQFVEGLPTDSTFDWACITYTHDNFLRKHFSTQTCLLPTISLLPSTTCFPWWLNDWVPMWRP